MLESLWKENIALFLFLSGSLWRNKEDTGHGAAAAPLHQVLTINLHKL